MSAQPIINYDALNGLKVVYAPKFKGLFRPHRYKVRWGGRGGAKSWSFARALVQIAHSRKVRVLCARELQNSIRDSVHRLLVDQINELGLAPWFYVTRQSIVSMVTGSEFLFKGLRLNATEIKSTEGIDIVWVEEAQLVSDESWELLIPTVRKENSEIWVSFNALEETDATYLRFVPRCLTCAKVFDTIGDAEVHKNALPEHDVSFPPPDCDVVKVNWDDNPWFPQVLEYERAYMLKKDPAAYEHVWNGGCRLIGDAVIFKDRYIVEPFDTPMHPSPRFYHGLDFGFADDPLAVTRSFITETTEEVSGRKYQVKDLWIDQELYRHHLEQDHMARTFDNEMPGLRKWPIKADNARPETIKFLKRRGFQVTPAEKWAGSVEDGISYLKSFRMIHIHPRCVHHAIEARLYSWKVDKKQKDKNGKPAILPVPVDRWNHCWDADRYGHDGLIHKGASEVWAQLGAKQ